MSGVEIRQTAAEEGQKGSRRGHPYGASWSTEVNSFLIFR